MEHRIALETLSTVDGPGPNERTARLLTADGRRVEVTAHASSFHGSALLASRPLLRRDGAVLVELPRESASGDRRLWVPA
jgi:hypothetical protein